MGESLLDTEERLNFTKAPALWEEQGEPREVIIHLTETGRTLKIPTPKKPYQTYTAGPLFTILQRKMIEEIATVMASKGVVPYIPHIQSKEVTVIGSKWKDAVFRLDVRGIDTSDFLTMWADYSVEPDPGTVWEQARAYTLNKPVIVLREDYRSLSRRRDEVMDTSIMNLMIEESIDLVATNLDELEKAVDEVIKYLDKKKSSAKG